MGQTLGNAAIKNEIRVNQRITMGYGFQMESNRLLGMANPPSTLLSQRTRKADATSRAPSQMGLAT